MRWRTGVHLNQQVDFVVGERLIGPAAEIEDAAESIPAAKRDRTRRAKTQVKTFPADRGRKTLEIGPGGVCCRQVPNAGMDQSSKLPVVPWNPRTACLSTHRIARDAL